MPKKDPLLVYLAGTRPVPVRKGRRTCGIKLITPNHKNVTFKLRDIFPGSKLMNYYHTDHLGSFFRAAIQFNEKMYIWDDHKECWYSDRIDKHLNNVLNSLKAIIHLMNTDTTKSWSERLNQAIYACSNRSVQPIIYEAYSSHQKSIAKDGVVDWQSFLHMFLVNKRTSKTCSHPFFFMS